jgi:hypothetical protein
MAFDLQGFKSAFADGGARPTHYDVLVTFPAVGDSQDVPGADGVAAANKLQFTCVGASLPESRMGVIEVPYFGRTIKEMGNRVYPDWTVSVINDEDFTVRAALEAWHAKMNGPVSNIEDPSYAGGLYKVSALITQYSKIGETPTTGGPAIATYEMVGLFPTLVSDIRLGYDRVNALEDYTVTFAYDWWEKVSVS